MPNGRIDPQREWVWSNLFRMLGSLTGMPWRQTAITSFGLSEFQTLYVPCSRSLYLTARSFRFQIKPKHLENLSLETEEHSKTTRVGTLKRKHAAYDVWSVGNGDENDDNFVGGEEMKSLSCLLPRKKKGNHLRIGIRRPVFISVNLLIFVLLQCQSHLPENSSSRRKNRHLQRTQRNLSTSYTKILLVLPTPKRFLSITSSLTVPYQALLRAQSKSQLTWSLTTHQ
jgi:hypothetical protein